MWNLKECLADVGACVQEHVCVCKSDLLESQSHHRYPYLYFASSWVLSFFVLQYIHSVLLFTPGTVSRLVMLKSGKQEQSFYNALEQLHGQLGFA